MINNTSHQTGAGKSRTGISFERFSASSRADFRFAPLNVLLLGVASGVFYPNDRARR